MPRDRSLDRYYSRRDGRYRARSRSPPPYRDRRERDRDRGSQRDYHPRDRDRDRRDLRRSPDASPDRRRRDDRGGRRDDSRDRLARSRREGTADTHHRNRREDYRRDHPAADSGVASSGNDAPNEADSEKLKAERLARVKRFEEKWRQKKEQERTAKPARSLLAEMDKKSSPFPTASPSSRPASGSASPAPAQLGSKPVAQTAKKADGSAAQPKLKMSGFTLKANRGRVNNAFGPEEEPPPKKLAKFDAGEDIGSSRKLQKLALAEGDDDEMPYADELDVADGYGLANTEEELAAAAREARARRLQESEAENNNAAPASPPAAPAAAPADASAPKTSESSATPSAPPAAAATNGATDAMDVDGEDDDIDPIDRYMMTLKEPAMKEPTKSAGREVYYDEEDGIPVKDGSETKAVAPMKKKNKKDIPQVDYSKLDLAPVRKNFWVEPAELSALSAEEATNLRLAVGHIKVSGKNVPAPVQKWAQCGLTRQILDVIEKEFEKPTPIQMQAIPAIMSGRDVVATAKTGSGKTLAFLLPMFRHIKHQTFKPNEGPIGLIITPTRELAEQIHSDCKKFKSATGLRAACAFGGHSIADHISDLKRGAQILVSTPGRLIDLLAANQGRVMNLTHVTYIVLDEADRLFDCGFEPQIMQVFKNSRPDKQTILFSATMPRIIESLTKKVLSNPVEITVGGKSVVAAEVEQVVEVRNEDSKFIRLLELLGELNEKDEDAKSLVFVDRQEKADDLLTRLMKKGYLSRSMHGSMDQADRNSAMADFKHGVINVLVATSVAARGLDVQQLQLVVNYDAPNHVEDYVHRVGRTGRAGNKGMAVTFVTEDQSNCAVAIAVALEQSKNPVPERLDKMRQEFLQKVQSGQAKQSSGFGGQGLDKLEAERKAARLREREAHKAEGEEEDFKEDANTKDGEKAKSTQNQIRAAASRIVARDAAKAEAPDAKADDKRLSPVPGSAAAGAGTTAGRPSAAATPIVKGSASGGDALESVKNAALKINSRLGKSGQLRAGQSIDNNGPDAGAFHATLEINDFPQKARWAVTNRTNVARILDATGTSITTKGTYYPPGKEPGPGQDPKLYILVEGDTEHVVDMALQEMERLLDEATRQAEETSRRMPAARGRYSIT